MSVFTSMCAYMHLSACKIERYILRLKSMEELPSLMQETFDVTAAE